MPTPDKIARIACSYGSRTPKTMAEERVQRRLAAILAADVVGYSRLMEQDEAGTLAALKARREDLLDPRVAKNMVMAGGFLYVIAFGAGALSFDNGWTKATSTSS